MEEAQAVGGDAAEADRLPAAEPRGHRLERRLAPDLGAEAVGDDDADARGQHALRELVTHGEVEPVAVLAVVLPLGVGAKVGEAALDIDDGEAALAVLAQHVRPPAGAAAARRGALAQTANGTAVGEEEAIRATREIVFAYVRTGDREADLVSRRGLIGLGNILASRTSVEPGPPHGVDVNVDTLAFYPLLYWPVTAGQAPPRKEGNARVHTFLRNGGMIVFDIRLQQGFRSDALANLVAGLKMPTLQRTPDDHVLTRSYYLLQRFPGRRTGAPVWVAQRDQAAKDGVSPVIIGANDWAAAWATDSAGRPMFPVQPGGEYQRELAYRVGVNIVMHALTGNYKADQVHIPTIIRRLGQ